MIKRKIGAAALLGALVMGSYAAGAGGGIRAAAAALPDRPGGWEKTAWKIAMEKSAVGEKGYRLQEIGELCKTGEPDEVREERHGKQEEAENRSGIFGGNTYGPGAAYGAKKGMRQDAPPEGERRAKPYDGYAGEKAEEPAKRAQGLSEQDAPKLEVRLSGGKAGGKRIQLQIKNQSGGELLLLPKGKYNDGIHPGDWNCSIAGSISEPVRLQPGATADLQFCLEEGRISDLPQSFLAFYLRRGESVFLNKIGPETEPEQYPASCI